MKYLKIIGTAIEEIDRIHPGSQIPEFLISDYEYTVDHGVLTITGKAHRQEKPQELKSDPWVEYEPGYGKFLSPITSIKNGVLHISNVTYLTTETTPFKRIATNFQFTSRLGEDE